MKQSWVTTDEGSDVVGSLDHCKRSLGLVLETPSEWKWAVIALHNAVQGALVCHLAGTALVGHLSPNSAKEWLAWLNGGRLGPAPREYMADPTTLLKRVSGGERRIEDGCGQTIEITREQQNAFESLNELRRDFAHFNPKGWSIQLDGLPRIFRGCLEIISQIAADPWPFRHLAPERRDALSSHLTGISQLIHAIDLELQKVSRHFTA